MIEMVVFDMAGTTVNEDNIVYKTLRDAIKLFGYEVSLNEVLADGAGREKYEAIEAILNRHIEKTDPALTSDIYKCFVVMLEKAYNNQPVYPQAGAIDIFSLLKAKGIRIILNTGYSTKIAELIISKLGWRKNHEFDELITAGQVRNNRPHPDMIRLAMERFGISDAHSVLKIGDSIIDIEEGKNSGCGLTIGITTGAHTREQLTSASPDFVIDHLSELPDLLLH